MKLSIAIPCYNGAAYLDRCLASVLRQSTLPDEILVIDDGSTDNSRTIAATYPVRVLAHTKNEGLATARNTALKAVSTEWLLFIDVDAVAAPNLVEVLQAEYRRAKADLAGVGGQGIEANIVTLADRWRQAHARQGHGSFARDVTFLYGLCMSFRTSMLRQVGGFNSAYRTNAEDMDIGFRLTKQGFRLRYVPEAVVYHQRQDDISSLTRAMSAWYSAAYRVKQQNQTHPWTLFVSSLRRMAFDPLTDVCLRHDVALAYLSVLLNYQKLKVLWQTAQIEDRQ